jgi:hypothetical protein
MSFFILFNAPVKRRHGCRLIGETLVDAAWCRRDVYATAKRTQLAARGPSFFATRR